MNWLYLMNALLAVNGPFWGVAAFVTVYVLLLVWLIVMPAQLLDEPTDRPWWKSSRLWAIAIAAIQILVYVGFG